MTQLLGHLGFIQWNVTQMKDNAPLSQHCCLVGPVNGYNYVYEQHPSCHLSGEPAEPSLQLHHINIYHKNQITVFPFVGHKYHSVLVGKEKCLNSTQRVVNGNSQGRNNPFFKSLHA